MKSYSKILRELVLLCLLFSSCSDQRSATNQTTRVESSAQMPDTTSNGERLIIKTADITMDVKQVEESVQSFQDLVNGMQGHIFHYEIKNEKQAQEEVTYTLDSSMMISQINPNGLLKVKIPVAKGDTFISAVLKMNGRIEHFLFDENDVTETITEKKELMLSDAGVSSQKDKGQKNKSVDENYFEKESRESFIQRKADFAQMNYKTKYLWFDIHLKGETYTNKQMMATAKSVHTPFYVNAVHALNKGWYAFSLFITLMLQLWPFVILGVLVWFVVKRKWLKQLFHSR